MAKSEVFFSRNISIPAQEDLSRIMGVRHVLGTGTYLGLPSMVGRNKKETFAFIKDRIWKRINSWRGRPFSRAGKEVMLKSVLQAIPPYVMSVYIIPDSTVNEIERMLNSFWWGGGNNNKGMRWLAWERMTYSKSEGGLGFRDFKAFNMAMVAKQGWHIMMNPSALVARIFKARCRWRIGDGSQIKVMLDPWLRNEGKGWVHSPQSQGVYNLSEKNLMMNGEKKWDTHKIMQLFSHVAAEEILKVPLMNEVNDDCLVWIEEQNGEYSVRTGYKLLMRKRDDGRSQDTHERWSSLWKIRAPPKVKHLLWRIFRDCLPTRVRLRQHHVPCPSICQLCEEEVEDEWHVLFGCTSSSQSWTAAGLSSIINSRLLEFTEVKNLIHDICSKETKELAGRFAVMVWSLWNNRNNWIWNNEKSEASQLGKQAFYTWKKWFEAQHVQPSSEAENQH